MKLIACAQPPRRKPQKACHAGQEPPPLRRQRPERPRRALDAVYRQPRLQEGAAASRRRQGHALPHRRRPQDHRRRVGHVVHQCRSWPHPDFGGNRQAGRGAGLCAPVPVRHSTGFRTCKPHRRSRTRRARSRVLLQFRIGGRGYRAQDRAGLSPDQRSGHPHPADRPRARLSWRRLRRHLGRRHCQ